MKKIIILIIAIFTINVAEAQWVQTGGFYAELDWYGCHGADYIGVMDSTIFISSSYTFGDNNVGWSCYSDVYISTDDGNSYSIIYNDYGFNVFASNGNNYYEGIYNCVNVNNQTFNWNHPVDTISGGSNIHALAINSTGDIFAGTANGIFTSTDTAKSWTAMNSGLTNTYINTIAISGSCIYAGTNGGMFSSCNVSGTWYSINWGITDTIINSIVIIGNKMFAGTKTKGVFLSTNNGLSWSAVNTGLTNLNIKTLAISGNYIFAGTSGGGVFLSKDFGSHWIPVNDGISSYNIRALAISDSSIFATTETYEMLYKRKLSDIINKPADAGTITGETNICQGENLLTFTVPQIAYATSYTWLLMDDSTTIVTNTNSLTVHFDSTAISGYISVAGTNSFGNGGISQLYINIIPQTFTPTILGNPNPQPFSTELYSVSQQLGKTYTWTVTNGNILNGLGTNYINVQWGNTGFGQVNVNVVDTNNSICSYSPFLNVNIGNLGIESIENNNGLIIYPNPATEILTIETNSNADQKVEIINLIGQSVYTSIINKKATINTSAFANGVYILKLSSDKETVVRKFVKE